MLLPLLPPPETTPHSSLSPPSLSPFSAPSSPATTVEGPQFDPFRKGQRLGRQLQEGESPPARRLQLPATSYLTTSASTNAAASPPYAPSAITAVPLGEGPTGRPEFQLGDTLLDLAIRNHRPEAVLQQIRELGGRSVNFKVGG